MPRIALTFSPQALCIRLDRSQQGVTPRSCLSKMPVKPRLAASPQNRVSGTGSRMSQVVGSGLGRARSQSAAPSVSTVSVSMANPAVELDASSPSSAAASSPTLPYPSYLPGRKAVAGQGF